MIIDAVIPARGASKRLPGKNLVDFDGKPLLVHSIEFAAAHRLVRRVVVTTDADDIARVAVDHGAEVVRRPPELADDHSTTAGAVAHAVGTWATDDPPDAVLTLQPTQPLRRPEWLDQLVGVLEDARFDSAMTVSTVSPKQGSIVDGEFVPRYAPGTRSQDLEPNYVENGLLYLTRAELVAAGELFGSRVGALVVDHLYATIDIDTPDDLTRARAVLRSL